MSGLNVWRFQSKKDELCSVKSYEAIWDLSNGVLIYDQITQTWYIKIRGHHVVLIINRLVTNQNEGECEQKTSNKEEVKPGRVKGKRISCRKV